MSLDISHVSYRIDGCLILDDVTATGDVGEIVGLIGPNGAGKSTLANVLNGIIQPSTGAVYLNGRNLIGISPEDIGRLGVARTFQGQHLPWNSTPRQCLLSVLTSDAKWANHQTGKCKTSRATFRNPGEEAQAFLGRVGLEDVSNTPARDLSFGQQRLLALAMACARSSRVLILDEPFAGLKSRALRLVLEVLRTEAKTKLLIVIDHTLSEVRAIASRYWFMHRGRLTNFSDYSEMAVSEVFFSHYLGASTSENNSLSSHKHPHEDKLSPPSHSRSVPNSALSAALTNVSAGYGNKVIVRGATLEVPPGEVVSIIGLNGSGKSTILRAIAGTARVFDGSVRLCGRHLDSLSADRRARMGVRFLPQDHRLFRTLSASDNLLVSAAGFDSDRARALVGRYLAANRRAKAYVANTISRLQSEGLAFTDRPAGTYSGGEQSRLALAQLDFGIPQLILLDEPTSGIDGLATQSLLSMIQNWQRRNIPLLIVEHALDFVALVSTQVFVMAGGTLHHVDPSVRDSAHLMEEILRRS